MAIVVVMSDDGGWYDDERDDVNVKGTSTLPASDTWLLQSAKEKKEKSDGGSGKSDKGEDGGSGKGDDGGSGKGEDGGSGKGDDGGSGKGDDGGSVKDDGGSGKGDSGSGKGGDDGSGKGDSGSGKVENGGSASGVFDVTKYGAKGDGSTDNTKAFQDTWAAVCASSGSPSFVIPSGTFLVGEIVFEGPCKNSGTITVEVTGNLVAPGKMSAFKESSWITFSYVKGFAIKGDGTIDGKGAEEAWHVTSCPKSNKCNIPPTSLKLISCSNGEVSGVKLKDSKAFNMRVNKCTNMNIHDVTISCPEDSPNTDGIHLSDSTNVKIHHSNIGVGDDCISVGEGNNGIDVRGVNCGPGHGISIGSLGKFSGEAPVNGIYVGDCTLTGTDNGVRIKTWPGSPSSTAKNITFENITMNKVSFPIIIDQNYCPAHHCTEKPSAVAISDVKYKGIKGTSFTKLAVNLICSSSLPCKGVEMSDIELTYQGTGAKTESMCQNVKPSVAGTMTPSGSCSA